LVAAHSTCLTGTAIAIVPCGLSHGQLIGTGTTCLLASSDLHLINVLAELTPR